MSLAIRHAQRDVQGEPATAPVVARLPAVVKTAPLCTASVPALVRLPTVVKVAPAASERVPELEASGAREAKFAAAPIKLTVAALALIPEPKAEPLRVALAVAPLTIHVPPVSVPALTWATEPLKDSVPEETPTVP